MAISMKVQAKTNIAAIETAVKVTVQLALDQLSEDIVADIKRSLSRKGTSKKIWPSKVDGSPHTASEPGKPPAKDTGTLRDSIKSKIVLNGSRRTLVVYADSNVAPYAKYLEFGTYSTGWGGPIAPRPFMRPALERHRFRIRGLMKKYMSKMSKKGVVATTFASAESLGGE